MNNESEILPIMCAFFDPIGTFSSVDYYSQYKGESMRDQANKMLTTVIERVLYISKHSKVKYVYFDGCSDIATIQLLKAVVNSKQKFSIIMREGLLFEIRIYRQTKSARITLLYIRNYRPLLDFPIEHLYRDFCNSEMKIPDQITCSMNEISDRNSIEKLKKNNALRAKALHEALSVFQNVIFSSFSCDITKSLSISSLSMRIYTSNFFGSKIYTNTKCNDAYIRAAYYGGHVDLYTPIGEKVFVYDVNSLYVFAMCQPMPSGMPEKIDDCSNIPLESLFGFIEADIICPKEITRPFLPLRHENRIYYPTGSWRGTYFSEELKFAKKIGYTIQPVSALVYQKEKSPFIEFADTLYEKRVSAKAKGNRSTQLGYKLILVSLYGRFGLRPDSTITEIGTFEDVQLVAHNYKIENSFAINDKLFVISYKRILQPFKQATNSLDMKARMKENSNKHFAKNRYGNIAVHIAAATTSYARMHMYPFIKDEAVLYTDTDSIITSKALPGNFVSSSVLGLFKLEGLNLNFIALAPKYYILKEHDSNKIIKVVKSGFSLKTQLSYEHFVELYQYLSNPPPI